MVLSVSLNYEPQTGTLDMRYFPEDQKELTYQDVTSGDWARWSEFEVVRQEYEVD
jgi:hypothetical protein